MSRPVTAGAGEPFDPDGVEWMRVSARLASARRLLLVAPAAVIAIVAALAATIAAAPSYALLALVPLAFAIWVWWLTGRQVRAWGYAERADDLLVRHGLMWRSIVVVPYGRMQYVDVHAGPVDRAFGIARVQLHTASAATDAVIPGLAPQEAARMRDRLASRGQAQLAGL